VRHRHSFPLSERHVQEVTGWGRGKAGRAITWARRHKIIQRVGHTNTFNRTILAFEPDSEPTAIRAANLYLLITPLTVDAHASADGCATVSASYIEKLPFKLSNRTQIVYVAPTWRPEGERGPPDQPEPLPTTTSTTGESSAPALIEREEVLALLRSFTAKLNRRSDDRLAERQARADAALKARLRAEAEERCQQEQGDEQAHGLTLEEFLG
jgi:hypothetical protein